MSIRIYVCLGETVDKSRPIPYNKNVLRREKGAKRVSHKQYRKVVQGNIPSLASVEPPYPKKASGTRKRYLMMFDNGEVLICGICEERIMYRRSITVDHIIPRSRGGSNYKANLQPAHGRCNGRKGNRLPGEEQMSNYEINKLVEYADVLKKYEAKDNVVDGLYPH